MELHKTSARGLCAHLTKQELSAYKLTFDELHRRGARTEALIRTVLTRAEKTLGWALPPRGKLFVDILPGENADTLLDILQRLQSPPFADAVCRLYRDESACFLQVSFPAASALRIGRTALSEYGEVFLCDERTQAYLHEYAVFIGKVP